MNCRECGRETDGSGKAGNPTIIDGLCNPCYKRIVWRPQNGAAIERERATSRAWKDRNREANRARDRAYARREDVRGRCQECGSPMGIGRRNDGTCAACLYERRMARARVIERMWADGWSMREIALRLGWSMNQLGVEMARLRGGGLVDLPYRRRVRSVV